VDPITDVDWSMGSRSSLLADWGTAVDVGRRIAGPGPKVVPADRARMREDLSGHVVRAEGLVTDFSRLSVEGFRSRAWVMGRGDWIRQNVSGLQRLLEPLADRIIASKPDRPNIARKTLGAQVGAIVGYVSRRVLGQYDVFLPPDDDGLIYFVGPNLVDVERRYSLPPSDFRLWVAIHEVTHRVQFSSAPWLRGHLGGLVDEYLATVSFESGELRALLRRAVDDLQHGRVDLRGPGGLMLLLTPEQRSIFERTQALMSLLEGHASYVMNEVAKGEVTDLGRLKRALAARRKTRGVEKAFQRAIAFDQKVAQYDAGERFVHEVIARAGIETFNQVWDGPTNLPTREEVAEPVRWVARVGS
jgi:coenzyme F420 biosynthesis associated uncharacterized protein